jgi:lysylphosphatidylglycerol synthetase-like protein (DUF2156 family)
MATVVGNTCADELGEGGDWHMGAVLLVLLLALILGGLGFAVHVLWWIALIVLAIWLVGFFVRSAEGSRWYRW